MRRKGMPQAVRLLEYMKANGSVSNKEGIELLGIKSPGAVISVLRMRGYAITAREAYGNRLNTRWSLLENPEAKQGKPKERNALKPAGLGTQGRKGKKLLRYNLGLTAENKEFIQVVARGTGQTQNRLINAIIDAYRREHPGLIDEARGMLELLGTLEILERQERQGI